MSKRVPSFLDANNPNSTRFIKINCISCYKMCCIIFHIMTILIIIFLSFQWGVSTMIRVHVMWEKDTWSTSKEITHPLSSYEIYYRNLINIGKTLSGAYRHVVHHITHMTARNSHIYIHKRDFVFKIWLIKHDIWKLTDHMWFLN